MAKNTTTTVAAVTHKGDVSNNVLTAAQMKRWGTRGGFRYTIGVAYMEAKAADRLAIIEFNGAGRVRRSLLVVSKAKGLDEATVVKVLAARDAIVTRLSAPKKVKAAPKAAPKAKTTTVKAKAPKAPKATAKKPATKKVTAA